ncbi:MAG: acetolactate synthase large subunit [Sedimentitalea sp.]
MSTSDMNGAHGLVHTLLASGVDTCFTNPGTSEMHFVAALDHIPGMRCVLTLFEGVATGAADGYFRIAGKPASTLLHLGPGLANGVANLHNAKKAGSGVVNIVGEHAPSHIELDAPLTADIEGIARPVSHWVRTAHSPSEAASAGAEAVAAAQIAPGQIATLVLPSDTAWREGGHESPALETPARPPFQTAEREAACAALDGPDSLLLLGGAALNEDALAMAGQIAAQTGCHLLSEWANARLDRGAGRVVIGRVPYPIDIALKKLAPYKRIVLLGARQPIGFFAYPGKPAVLTDPDAQVIELATAGQDLHGALVALRDQLGATDTNPAHIAPAQIPDAAQGAITPDTIAVALARTMPEDAIVVDESVTTGRAFFPVTAGAPRHTWLNNCGGSIGYGLPVAIGAAIAAPQRKVLALTGDGSAMYTVQALWTMAREELDVTVVIFANRSYQILRGELANMGAGNPGPRAIDMLTLDRPNLNFVDMAVSMGVPAEQVSETSELERALTQALATPGPRLIEVLC